MFNPIFEATLYIIWLVIIVVTLYLIFNLLITAVDVKNTMDRIERIEDQRKKRNNQDGK